MASPRQVVEEALVFSLMILRVVKLLDINLTTQARPVEGSSRKGRSLSLYAPSTGDEHGGCVFNAFLKNERANIFQNVGNSNDVNV